MAQYIVTCIEWGEMMVLKKFDQEDEDNRKDALRYAKTVDSNKEPQVWRLEEKK